MSLCKSCKAPILWATTPAGKLMPLDAKVETLYYVDYGVRPRVESPVDECRDNIDAREPIAEPVLVRRPHWASCPNADQHRKPREG